MEINDYILKQELNRQWIISQIHHIILLEDKTVKPSVGKMMGKEMILYHAAGNFKYGLSSIKNYISLHLMPIYCNKVLHNKYELILKDASFQKGCINFKNEDQMPIETLKLLIKDCAKVDLSVIMESLRKNRNESKI